MLPSSHKKKFSPFAHINPTNRERNTHAILNDSGYPFRFQSLAQYVEALQGVHPLHTGKVKDNSVKQAKTFIQETKLESLDNLNLGACCQYDSSFGLLNKKFIKLIGEAKNGTLDLNGTANILEILKRRVYDIRNVLECINLTEKTTKNHIWWKGSGIHKPTELDNEISLLKAEFEYLSAQESRLDDCIRDRLQRLRKLETDQNCQKNLFLIDQDFAGLPLVRDDIVFAVQAPRASFIEVPDPEEVDTSI